MQFLPPGASIILVSCRLLSKHTCLALHAALHPSLWLSLASFWGKSGRQGDAGPSPAGCLRAAAALPQFKEAFLCEQDLCNSLTCSES